MVPFAKECLNRQKFEITELKKNVDGKNKNEVFLHCLYL